MLERFEFKRVTQQVVSRRERLREWVTKLVAQNLPVNLPASVLDDARRINYQELTVEEKYVAPSADDLARIEREKARVARLWTLDTPRRFSLPLAAPLT